MLCTEWLWEICWMSARLSSNVLYFMLISAPFNFPFLYNSHDFSLKKHEHWWLDCLSQSIALLACKHFTTSELAGWSLSPGSPAFPILVLFKCIYSHCLVLPLLLPSFLLQMFLTFYYTCYIGVGAVEISSNALIFSLPPSLHVLKYLRIHLRR